MSFTNPLLTNINNIGEEDNDNIVLRQIIIWLYSLPVHAQRVLVTELQCLLIVPCAICFMRFYEYTIVVFMIFVFGMLLFLILKLKYCEVTTQEIIFPKDTPVDHNDIVLECINVQMSTVETCTEIVSGELVEFAPGTNLDLSEAYNDLPVEIIGGLQVKYDDDNDSIDKQTNHQEHVNRHGIDIQGITTSIRPTLSIDWIVQHEHIIALDEFISTMIVTGDDDDDDSGWDTD